MTMDPFFHSLRQAREEKNISLQHISEATLINIRFLEAIERGDISILPQTYIRAFLREYASFIGLDPSETMKRYDQVIGAATPAAEPPSGTESPVIGITPKPTAEAGSDESLGHAKTIRTATLVILVAAAIVVLAILRNGSSTPPPREMPFQNVVKENEERIAGTVGEKQVAAKSPSAAPGDSLRLAAVITDSVWVYMVIDQQEPKEYLFPPNRKMSWKAHDRFVITLGNAGAIQFTLNQKFLGTLGKSGTVVRNIEISRAALNTRP
jgi:hypothetical protein